MLVYYIVMHNARVMRTGLRIKLPNTVS
jgi:hypothetical protein